MEAVYWIGLLPGPVLGFGLVGCGQVSVSFIFFF
jgi:hypothetical protein